MLTRRRSRHTPEGEAFTALVLETFRFNGMLIAAGNALCEGTGLTAARWQVLGAIDAAGQPVTVSDIARLMGLTRQTVQRLVDELENLDVVNRTDHPQHGRARLVELTASGAELYEELRRRQAPWANGVAEGFSASEITTALNVLRALRERLEKPRNEERNAR